MQSKIPACILIVCHFFTHKFLTIIKEIVHLKSSKLNENGHFYLTKEVQKMFFFYLAFIVYLDSGVLIKNFKIN